MKRIISVLLVIIGVMVSDLFAKEVVMVSQIRRVSAFDRLSVGGGMTVKFTQGEQFRVEVRASEDIIHMINSTIRNGELKFEMSKEWYSMRRRLLKNQRIELVISAPKLVQYHGSGGSVMIFENGISGTELVCGLSGGAQIKNRGSINVDEFRVAMSGGSILNSKLDCKRVSISLSGGAIANVNGTCEEFKVAGSGGAITNSEKLTAQKASVKTSGGCIVNLGVIGEKLDVSSSGGCVTKYSGEPKSKEVNTSGGSVCKNRS